MRSIRSLVLCTCAFTVVTFLGGCGANSVPVSSSTNSGTGPVPAVTAQAVEVNGVAPNRKQEVQFSEAMDPTTINAKTFLITDAGGNPVPGDVSYDSNFNVGIFQPTPALTTGASYTATITTGAASTGGMHLTAPYTYSFATRADTDSSPLSVLKVSPQANAVCVSPGTQIMITFDEAPDASTVTSQNIVVTDSSGNKIATSLSINVSTTQVVVTPTSPLPSGTITVTVSGIGDLADQMMQQPYTWSFSTACNTGGGGGGTSGNVQYQAPLLDNNNMNYGQVSVDTQGNTTVQLTGASPNTDYFVQFCPAVAPGAPNATTPCFAITEFITDGTGNGSSTLMFPQEGDWAGDFAVEVKNAGTYVYHTRLAPNNSSETYTAALLPETQTNGAADTTVTSQDPLTSGTVTYSNGSLKFTVQGAAPDTTYTTDVSETTVVDSSSTYELSTFTTDSTGNGSSTTTLGGTPGDIFQVRPAKSAGFIGGFSIPHP